MSRRMSILNHGIVMKTADVLQRSLIIEQESSCVYVVRDQPFTFTENKMFLSGNHGFGDINILTWFLLHTKIYILGTT